MINVRTCQSLSSIDERAPRVTKVKLDHIEPSKVDEDPFLPKGNLHEGEKCCHY